MSKGWGKEEMEYAEGKEKEEEEETEKEEDAGR